MDVTAAELERRYSSAGDEIILEAIAAGPSSYTAVAWSIISREAQKRGLDRLAPSSYAPPPADAHRTSTSTFFLWSRFVQRTPWDYSERPLPLRGLYLLGGWGALGGAWLFADVFSGMGRNLGAFLGALAVELPCALVLIACVNPRRRWKWYYLMWFMVVSAFLVMWKIARQAGSGMGEIAGPVNFMFLVAWGLYLARRRPAFGLGLWKAFN